MVAAAIAGGAAVSAAGSIGSAALASHAQTSSANDATNAQLQMFGVQQQNLAPYEALGQLGNAGLTNNLSALTAPVNMDQATLEKTPGYQFTLSQGLESVNNQAASQGLANSGAQQKAAANYATGLASSTYQQQFNNAVTNQTNTYNRLLGLTDVGESAAAGVGAGALQTGGSIGSNIIGAGNAQAGMFNSIGNSLSSGASGISNGFLLNGLTGGSLFGGSTSAANTYNGLSPAAQVAQDVQAG